MAIVTDLDTNCLIALADAEPYRAASVFALLGEKRRSFIYSPFVTLETLSLAIHYQKSGESRSFAAT